MISCALPEYGLGAPHLHRTAASDPDAPPPYALPGHAADLTSADGDVASAAGSLSVALRTFPKHRAQLWLDGELLAEQIFEGCPHPPNTYGVSCAPCASCPQCAPCASCLPASECPLRTADGFSRLTLDLAAVAPGANDGDERHRDERHRDERQHLSAGGAPERSAADGGVPPVSGEVRATYKGMVLFGGAVGFSNWTCGERCVLALGARTGENTDHHRADNLVLTATPARPAPPSLLNASRQVEHICSLSHSCHALVTLLSHSGHTLVTLLSHSCHTLPTLFPPSSHTLPTLFPSFAFLP